MRISTRMKSVTESATMRLNSASQRLREQGTRVINLSVGECEDDTPPYIVRAVARTLHKNKYTSTPGLLELRQAIARDVSKKYRWKVTPEHVAVTAGAKQALYNVFQLICNPGDEVIIPTPCWVSYEHMVTLSGARPVFVPTHRDFSLNVPAIARAITKKTRAVIINSPNNPTGAVYEKRALTALAKTLADKDIYIIADDIYDSLVYEGSWCPITTCFKDKSRPILVNGFSKSHALTGWRVGYMVADPELIRANNRFQSHTSGNASVPSQYAALASYTRAHTARARTALARKRALIVEHLLGMPGITVTPPQGALYAFVDVRAFTGDSVDFCERLLRDAHVAVVPGEAFHAPGFFRMSFAVDTHELTRGLTRLRVFLEHETTRTHHA